MSVAIRSIEAYQRHISPHKGFCCAYRIATNEVSCSEFAKQRIANRGFFKALADIRQRFNACKQAALQLHKSSEKQRKSKGDTFMNRYCSCDPSPCCMSLPEKGAAGMGGCDGCACTPF